MFTNKNKTLHMLLLVIFACLFSLSMAYGPQVRTELAQISADLNRGGVIGPIVNGTPMKETKQ